jgi:preprotein translocase subunit SecG
MLPTVLRIFHVIFVLLLIVVILMQKGTSGGMMSMGGASQTLFGSQGSGSFMTKLTSIIASLFFATSLALGIFYPSSQKDSIAPLFVRSDTPTSEASDT